MKKIIEGDALKAHYIIKVLKGTVQSTETRLKTEVTGDISGGGGMTYHGTGATAPVTGKIESKTTHYRDIYLKDEDGQEHAIELVDFNVPCKQGHRLTFFTIVNGHGNGAYFRIYNHNTRQTYGKNKNLRSEMYPFSGHFKALAAVTILGLMWVGSHSDATMSSYIFGALIIGFVGFLLLAIPGLIIAFLRGKEVLANPELARYMEQLRSETPPASADAAAA